MKTGTKTINLNQTTAIDESYSPVDLIQGKKSKTHSLVMGREDKKFVIVDKFSTEATKIAEDDKKKMEIKVQPSKTVELVYAEEIFDDEGDLYTQEFNDTKVVVEKHRTFRDISLDVDEALSAKGKKLVNSFGLLCAMQFSRILLANNKDGLEENLFDLFDSLNIPHFVITQNGEDPISHDPVLYDVINFARDNTNKPVFVYLKDVGASDIHAFLRPIYQYFDNPDGDVYLSALGKSVYIPHNIFFIVSLKDGDVMYDVSRRLLRYMSVFNFEMEKVIPNEKAKPVIISLEELSLSLREATEDFNPNEDTWKKIDELIIAINKVNGYILQNKVTRRLENYTVAYLSGGDEDEKVLDTALSSNIIHEAVLTSQPQLFITDNDIFKSIDHIFGNGKLPMTRKVIKDYLALFDKGGNRINADE